jgi:hypothetical protein
MSYIEFLRSAIKNTHGCDSRHVKTVLVTEEFQGVAWEGEVDVFELEGHPGVAQCYAWCQRNQESKASNVVKLMLALPPVITPESAIRSFLAELVASNQQPEGSNPDPNPK